MDVSMMKNAKIPMTALSLSAKEVNVTRSDLLCSSMIRDETMELLAITSAGKCK